MRIEITEKGEHQLKEVYNPISLKSNDGEIFRICMRDTGFEFFYGGIHHEAKNGKINKL